MRWIQAMADQQRIVVDYSLLGHCADSLRSIGAEFEHAARIKGALVGQLGSAGQMMTTIEPARGSRAPR